MPSVAGMRVASPVSKDPSSRRLLQGSSSTTQFLRCMPSVTLSPGGRTAKRKKKPSRRHARFMARKAFLERKGILKRSRFKKKEGPLDQARCSNASKLSCTVHSGDTKQSGASDVNVNRSVSSRPESESGRSTFSPKPTSLSTRAHPVRRANALTREEPARPLPATAPCLASPPHFCPNPAKYVAIDCEMVGTGPCGRNTEVARCSIVNYQGDVIYDKYVKPEHPITDYRTRWSGIRQQHMTNAIEFNVAQREIMKILKGKILVGHALHNDFKALKYFHPRSLIRDTSKILMLKRKAGFPERDSVSLKNLAKQLLGKNIQVGRDGHCSVEDACSSMELYRLVEIQWEQKLCNQLSAEHEHTASETNSEIDHYMDDQYWPADLHEDSK
ncbi:apoptosis-enhancing nuclease-like isoform X1 [Carcharodon carcharias]|uniref:apoptosis-enhancing nuclease-like isoform X1 n=1 Tax=Carcharodon carcharias TaxID=13397 RepID=UPI001B7E6EB9|nr:apoptosis-enhancing nuclease-like isoform X1 [Carcharodon carcharias]XP_041030817.1 apoptosis-enhancing nuclease-like isoform X1 [Carcharodon carcharias]